MDKELLKSKKIRVLENINYAKENNINKISAIIINEDDEMQKELLSWLIQEGYKVSLRKDDMNVLLIEW